MLGQRRTFPAPAPGVARDLDALLVLGCLLLGEFLRLEDGEWRVSDVLGGNCSWFDGMADGRLFAIISIRRAARRLLGFDGSIWRDITPEDAAQVWGCYLGNYSGTLYAYCHDDSNWFYRVYRNGQWEEFPASEELSVDISRLQEAADGGLYLRLNRRIYRLHPGGWKQMYEHENSLYHSFVHPDRGLYGVDSDDRLHHHPYRPR